ncbi:glycine/betaine ABC transporter [Paenibacillus crassostreae]|uniref:Glycine/betaine ABC transporter n=2 Tax=Paenibacillus crassostreae TaxID=1763538 RepID=A0A167BHW4_9BACL|nr:glycine betaine ABC transporter substrate-binding protein [Paenibacillus crassostreae]AOZ94704.1 glycine/betaine ABC transporter [Paenibacillus crassostreae]OAB72084.1 glycine/betaine ABC transporter [Paenibacillus crassostreae]
MKKKINILLMAFIAITLVLAGCSTNGNGNEPAGNNGNATEANKDKELTLAYVAWDSEIASTNVVKEVLESKLNYKVEMLQVDAGPMYIGIADGSADAMVAAWLPSTHGENYYEPNKDKFEDLGVNLDGTKNGLVVPSYMDITSIEDLAKADVGETLDHTITGIEPGAGIMTQAETAIVDYGLKDWNLLESSSAAMVKVLQDAYANQEPIVVTGWTPHWMFADMDLKYLDDSKGIFGGSEQIHTLVRLGLKEDQPAAYQFLDQFEWTPADMEMVMIDIAGGMTEQEAAQKWIAANEAKVNEWIAGIE